MKPLAVITLLLIGAWLILISTTQHMVVRGTAGEAHSGIEERDYSTREVHAIVDKYHHSLHERLNKPLVSPMYPAIASILIAGWLALGKQNRK